jgi:hypothetical protein
LVAVLAEAHFLLHGWLRSGTARGVVEFLKEALAMLPEKYSLRVVVADAGFFDQQLQGFLEQRGLPYIVAARLTRWLKREAARVTEWRALDEHYSVGEFSLQLLGWDRPRGFVVIREQLRTERASLGRKLLEGFRISAIAVMQLFHVSRAAARTGVARDLVTSEVNGVHKPLLSSQSGLSSACPAISRRMLPMGVSFPQPKSRSTSLLSIMTHGTS